MAKRRRAKARRAKPRRAKPRTTEQPTGGQPARPELSEVLSWVGSRLDGMDGGTAGRVEGAYVDEVSGRPEWLLVRVGRFGHHAPVPAREAVGGVGHVWVPYDRDAIKDSPKADAGSPLTRERELELLSHFGVAGEVGRAAEITERGPDAVTARPAS